LPLAGFPFSEVNHMSHQAIVTLRPSRLDVAISKRCARAATPARERSLQIMTADMVRTEIPRRGRLLQWPRCAGLGSDTAGPAHLRFRTLGGSSMIPKVLQTRESGFI
jgi:hypothetical protein